MRVRLMTGESSPAAAIGGHIGFGCRHARHLQPVAAARRPQPVYHRPRPERAGRGHAELGRRRPHAIRRAMGHAGDLRTRPHRQRLPADPEDPRRQRASGSTMSSSIRPGTRSCGAALPPACTARSGTPAATRPMCAPSARAARLYMAAQVEAGHLCPMTMTNAAVAALAHAPGACRPLAAAHPHAQVRFLATRPVTEKAGVTVGMGMTEKQGGSDVSANTTAAVEARRRHVAPHRPQVVPVGADQRRLPGAGAGAGRAVVFPHAAPTCRTERATACG